jgi:hypothetical protein
MGDKTKGTVVIGTPSTPIALGATGGGTDVGTYSHNLGKKALKISVVDDVNGAAIPNATITITQPDADTIVATNTTAGALNAVIIAEFEIGTPQFASQVDAGDVVLS